MKRLAVIGVLAALLAGCGASGATDQEVKEQRRDAFEDGRKVGAVEGESAAERASADRMAQARRNGYWEGWDEGWDAGEESAFELEEEWEREEEGLNPYPYKQDGSRSFEFEPDDIERAEEGHEDDALREYCEGAVSEAQELGCLSHVDPSEVP